MHCSLLKNPDYLEYYQGYRNSVRIFDLLMHRKVHYIDRILASIYFFIFQRLFLEDLKNFCYGQNTVHLELIYYILEPGTKPYIFIITKIYSFKESLRKTRCYREENEKQRCQIFDIPYFQVLWNLSFCSSDFYTSLRR